MENLRTELFQMRQQMEHIITELTIACDGDKINTHMVLARLSQLSKLVSKL